MGGETRKGETGSYRRAQEKRRAGGQSADRLASAEGTIHNPPGSQGADLEDVVRWASERGDGWLRIVPALTGEVHWKWRFTSGRWAGHYVYWAQTKFEGATSAWTGLAGKLDLVDEGQLKPSRDVY